MILKCLTLHLLILLSLSIYTLTLKIYVLIVCVMCVLMGHLGSIVLLVGKGCFRIMDSVLRNVLLELSHIMISPVRNVILLARLALIPMIIHV